METDISKYLEEQELEKESEVKVKAEQDSIITEAEGGREDGIQHGQMHQVKEEKACKCSLDLGRGNLGIRS